ncbi:MAG: hypothetical protein LW833_01865 [Hyphomicrobiales bacterium]|nr:hypothetical protein [Hyphomicrobiales bacterium]
MHALGLVDPSNMFSLSHIAIPFATNDGLDGFAPDDRYDLGIWLGTLTARAEIGSLIMTIDTLMCASSNLFFSFVKDKITQNIPPGSALLKAH